MVLVAFIDIGVERFAQLVVNVLAVGGGFLIGQMLTAFVAWFLDRWLTGGKTPLGFKEAAKRIGGVTLAVLVALIVFGHGEGWTLFGGGGTGAQNEAEGDKSGGTPATTPDVPTTRPTPEPITPPRVVPASTANAVQITMLGGEDVQNQRFYQIDTDSTPKTLSEVKEVLLARKTESPQGLGVLIRFSPSNVLPRTHPAVLLLSQWAQDNGIAVTFPAENS